MVSSMYVCFVTRKHDMFKTNQQTKSGFQLQKGPAPRGGWGVYKHSISNLLPQTRGATKPLFILQIQGKIIAASYLKMLRKPPKVHLYLRAWRPWRAKLLVMLSGTEVGVPQWSREALYANPGQGSWLCLRSFNGKELLNLCHGLWMPANLSLLPLPGLHLPQSLTPDKAAFSAPPGFSQQGLHPCCFH